MPYLNKDSEAYITEFYTSDEFQGELSKSEVVDFKKKQRTERQSGTLFLILGFSLVFVSPIVFNDFNTCFSIFLIGFILSIYGIVIHDKPIKKVKKRNDKFQGISVNYRFETVLDGVKIKGKRIDSIEMQMIDKLHMDYPLLMREFDNKKWFLYKDQTWITDNHYEQNELVVFPTSKDSGQKEEVAVIGKYKTKKELDENTSSLKNKKTFTWSDGLKKVLDGDEEKEDPVQKITPKVTDNMNFIKNYIKKLNENTTELRGEEIITETQSRNLIKFTEFNGKMGEAARELGYKRPKSLRENLKIISSKTGELYRIINSIKNNENLQDKYKLPKNIDEIYPKVVTKETSTKIGSATAKMWEEEAGSRNTLNQEAKKVNDEELYEILADFPSYSESDGTLEIKRTWLETLLLHNKGLNIEEIARERNLTKETISKHLTILVKMKIIKDFKNLTEENNYQIMLKYIQSNYSKSSFSPFSIYDDEDPAKTPHYGFIDLFLAINESKKEGFPNNNNFRTYEKASKIYQNQKLDRDEKISELNNLKISHKEIGSLTNLRETTVKKIILQKKKDEHISIKQKNNKKNDEGKKINEISADEKAIRSFTNTRLKNEMKRIFDRNSKTPYAEWKAWLKEGLEKFKFKPRLEAIKREIIRIEPLVEKRVGSSEERQQCKLYHASRCLDYAEPGKDFCDTHRNIDKKFVTEIKGIYYFKNYIDGNNYLGKPFFNLPKFNEDKDFVKFNEGNFETRIENVWEETMDSIFDEYPDIKLTEIFDFIQYSLDEEQIYVKIKEIVDWYKATQKDNGHPIEILDPKYRFYLNQNPYKKFLDEGLPILDEEKVEEFIDKKPNTSLNEISKETGVTKQRVSQICKELGISVGGQRKGYGTRTSSGFSQITNKRYNCEKCGNESKVWEGSNLAKSNLCVDCYRA